MQEHLASANARAAQLISIAEQLFGPMSSPWTYAGVTFRDQPPHLYYFPEATSVQIALSLRAVGDDLQRDFQLSHEVCHLLYPSIDPIQPDEPRTIVLNEGISAYFSVIVVATDYGDEAAGIALENLATHSPNYFRAFKLVLALMQRDRDAIKKLRAIQPMINETVTQDLLAADLGLTQEEAEDLVAIC
ncbi:hypothetical protein [Desulfonatronum lacustre]|uniref:hypothetical protein n=1 Tax=Desulfonatronum lacustre TaxID=66849 RepID=UPI00048DFFDB|nr:hypothetical protein [Desulfonatronum lacustre]